MKRIVLACSAGMSTSLVVTKMEKEATARVYAKGAAKWLGWLIAAALLGAALAGAAILGRDSGLQEGVQEATKYFTSNPPQPADDKQEARP